MAHYRKMIAAVVGVVVIYINNQWGMDFGAASPAVIDGLLALGTVVGVWGVPND